MTVCQISVGKKKQKQNKQTKKKKQKKKTASLLIFIQVEKINSKGGKIKDLAQREKKRKSKERRFNHETSNFVL